jgi:pimeloyl-ACP methyl ester carboxylesterase
MAGSADGTLLVPIEEIESRAIHGSAETESGGEIHYWVYGSGPTRVIFLEGLDSTHYGWEEQIAALTSPVQQGRFSVMAVDNRGSGKSRTTPGPYTSALLARDAREALRRAGWWPAGGDEAAVPSSERVHAVGLSLGGMIAQELFLLRPAAFASVSLVSTHAGGPKICHGRATTEDGFTYQNLPLSLSNSRGRRLVCRARSLTASYIPYWPWVT